MKKPQYDVDYTLLDSDDGKKTGVGIKTGKYAGILYHYGKVRLSEENDFAKLTFAYSIIFSPNISMDELIEDEDFLELMGDILSDILINQKRAKDYFEENEEQELLVYKEDEET